jgi:phosphotransacetylase
MMVDMQMEWFLEQPIRRNIRFYQHYNLLKQNPIHLWFLRSFYVLRRPSFCFWDCNKSKSTAEQLAEIAISSDSSLLWIEPKNSYAILFFWSIRKGDEVDKVRAATEIEKKRPEN